MQEGGAAQGLGIGEEVAPSVVLNMSCTAPLRTASAACGRPSETLLTFSAFSPWAVRYRWVPPVARILKPSACSFLRKGSTIFSLSTSRTEMNTAPDFGGR